MFDIGWPELLLVMVIALLVIGPKELPNAIRTVVTIVRKLRLAAREFQSSLDDIARESGVDDIKRQLDDIEYYDPGEALKSIADSDKDLLGLDDDPGLPSGNSIFDPNAAFIPPDETASGTDEERQIPSDKATTADEDDPQSKPAASGTST
ncbi:MAG: twin-arginine translocase subunit TatB [Rhodospirillaceae bacterium]|nr:twin-arginine translocase subunit TatB [Rhodospirillaceae bacterium]